MTVGIPVISVRTKSESGSQCVSYGWVHHVPWCSGALPPFHSPLDIWDGRRIWNSLLFFNRKLCKRFFKIFFVVVEGIQIEALLSALIPTRASEMIFFRLCVVLYPWLCSPHSSLVLRMTLDASFYNEDVF